MRPHANCVGRRSEQFALRRSHFRRRKDRWRSAVESSCPGASGSFAAREMRARTTDSRLPPPVIPEQQRYRQDFNTATYDHIEENPFLAAASNPLSTFSIDVDTASYSNVRRFIENGCAAAKGCGAGRGNDSITSPTIIRSRTATSRSRSISKRPSCPWEPAHRWCGSD